MKKKLYKFANRAFFENDGHAVRTVECDVNKVSTCLGALKNVRICSFINGKECFLDFELYVSIKWPTCKTLAIQRLCDCVCAPSQSSY